MIQAFFSGMVTMMLAKFILNDVPHAVLGNPSSLGNPGNPSDVSSSTTSAIISRTGMKEYEYTWFPPPAEERPGRIYPYRKKRDVSHYSIVMTRTNGACTIKLYENLEGWRQKLRATWTALDKPECDMKFEEIAGTIRQVVFEEKTALMGKA